MEKKTGNHIKLGVFVSLTLICFIVGIYFIGQRQKLFSSTFHVSGVFADISGLQIGNNVRFSGINVGIVEDIEQISDSSVRVDMQLVDGSRKFIKKSAIAIIGSDGLMGSKIIVILPGTASQLQLADDDELATARQVNMDDIMYKLKETSDNAALITGDLAVVMKSVREGKGTIGMLLMDSLFAENLDQALVSVRQGAGGFKQNMDAASHNFLLRGFLKRKERAKEKERLKALEEAKDKQKKK